MTDRIPNGFARADIHQAESFERTGSINGASKVTIVNGEVVCRLRPPRRWADVVSALPRREYGAHNTLTSAQQAAARDWYVDQYNKGWAAAGRATDMPDGSHAFDDGYLDRAAGRMKWHLTYCPNHDTCGEG